MDQSTIDHETASGLAKIVISEDCDWGVVARKDDISVIAIRGTDTQHQWLEDFRAIAQPVSHRALVDASRFLRRVELHRAEFAEGVGHGVFGQREGLHHWSQLGGGGGADHGRATSRGFHLDVCRPGGVLAHSRSSRLLRTWCAL